MSLTKQQSYNAWLGYLEALQNTRLSYLRLLENPGVSNEDENKIWAVSLVLQYMMDNHKKYNDLLTALQKDKQAQALINKLFDQITIDPATNLQGFIAQVQATMQSAKFKSELTGLVHQIEKSKNVSLYSVLGGISGYLLFISCTVLMPFVGLWALCAIVPLLIGAGIFLTMAAVNDQQIKIIKDPIRNFSLQATEPPAFSLTEEYSYKKGNADYNSIKKISMTHQPESREKLRQSFFQPQMGHKKTLNEEVQLQFSKLSTPN